MSKYSFLLGALIFMANAVQAKVPGTAWVGAGDLSLEGILYCSAEPAKKPLYRPVIGGPMPSFTIHEGGWGWIWPQGSGGCASGWLRDYFELQVVGSDLLDKNGKVVGKITDSEIQAGHYSGAVSDIKIVDFNLVMTSEETATVSVQFTHKNKTGIFIYHANLTRYRDVNWK